MDKWWILVKERFSPTSYIPMILLFVWVNGQYGLNLTGLHWTWERFLIVFVLILSFFFRMRLFDEIKDYHVDLKINPTRPLVRGVLSILDVKKALCVLILLELGIAGVLGLPVFLIHFAAIAYSLLMYREFFIGPLLRPHLTTYAVSHTFVSTLLGLSSAVAATGTDPRAWPLKACGFFVMNWAFFNLFEFARKTFAPSEERENVPSYSNIFGCWGAMILSASQAVIGIGIAGCYLSSYFMQTAGGVYISIGLYYALSKTPFSANMFRQISGLYLLIHYFITAIALGV